MRAENLTDLDASHFEVEQDELTKKSPFHLAPLTCEIADVLSVLLLNYQWRNSLKRARSKRSEAWNAKVCLGRLDRRT